MTSDILKEWEDKLPCSWPGCSCGTEIEGQFKALIHAHRVMDGALLFISEFVSKNDYNVVVSTREASQAIEARAQAEKILKGEV